MASGDLIPRMYSDFRGVDFRGGEVDLRRSPDALNMWKDYKQPDGIRKRPSELSVANFSLNKSCSIIFYTPPSVNGEPVEEMMLVQNDNKLYKVVGGELIKIDGYLGQPKGGKKLHNFVYDGILYIVGFGAFYRFDGTTLEGVEGYIPTTSISRNPEGGGSVREDVNMLSPYRKNSFIGDGTKRAYYLDAQDIDSDEMPVATVNGVVYDENNTDDKYRITGVNWIEGFVNFKNPPPAPETADQDNVCIKFKKTVEEHGKMMGFCDLVTVFDNRVFFSGNPHYPNMIWHSSLDDPTYVSDLDYYIEGQDNAPVKAMVPGNNALWVFKEPSQEHNSIFYHVPTIDAEYGKIYPSTHSNLSTGCVATGINFNDDIVFFSDRGMEGIAGEVTTEQVLAHRSSLVDAKLLAEENYKNMILEEWEGYLLVIIGKKIYLADSRALHQVDNHYEYEWFYWELRDNIACTRVHNGVLYLGAENGGIYALNGPVKGTPDELYDAYWTTPLDKFANPQYLKTTNKRGCVIEAAGSFEVQVKTNKSDWEKVGSFSDVDDYAVCRIKRKKFKDVQLKFYSPRRPPRDFVLESATLECYVGGYIKR